MESRFYTCKSCISIHALRKEGDFRKIKTLLNGIMISIHALREEGDGVALGVDGGAVISIHALREEGDTVPQIYC